MTRCWNPRDMEAETLRWLSRGLYLFESVCAAVVLGINSWYLSHYNDTPVYPQARLIYVEIIAGLAIPLANLFAWMYDCFPRFLTLVNLFFSLAFFAAFGLLIEFNRDKNWLGWQTDVGKHYRPCWKAIESFCFIGAFFWLCSAYFAWYTPSCGRTILHRKKSSTNSSSAPSEQV